MKKGGLSKGLGDILNDSGRDVLAKPELETLKEIDVARIQAGRYQPRRLFDEQALSELAQSISEHGVLQPLVVRPIGHERYEIVAGERRFRASQRAGLNKVPCVVKHYDDRQALAVALIENLQRSDLNALEEAQGLQQLANEFSLSHERIAQLIGRSRSAVSNSLRLLGLSEPVKQALSDEKIDMGHARALLSLSPVQQQMMVGEIIAKELTVRQTEARVRQLLKGEEEQAVKMPLKNADIEALESRVSDFLGFAVAINHKKKGNGKIVLKYQSLDELESIFGKWGFDQRS